MSTSLARNTATTKAWRWYSATGPYLLPSEMQTTHLFFVLRMIWNHSMPKEMRVGGETKRYSFGLKYTTEYMRQAVVNVYYELQGRTDLPPNLQAQLAQMKAFFGQVELPGRTS